MPVQVFWHDETKQNILVYQFTGRWTWKEYYTVLADARTIMQSVTHPVCILNDMLNSTYLPTNFLIQAKSVIDSRPKNTGLVVFVSTNFFFDSMYSVMIRLYPEMDSNYKLDSSLDSAIERLEIWLRDNHPQAQTAIAPDTTMPSKPESDDATIA